jgi:hypothetical protein
MASDLFWAAIVSQGSATLVSNNISGNKATEGKKVEGNETIQL